MARRILSLPLAFALLFPANGLFHLVIASEFFDRQLAPLSPAIRSMRDANPLAVAVLDLVIVLATITLIVRVRASVREGAAAGAAINLLTSASWNLANTASFVAWPLVVTIADIAWHVSLGTLVGAATAWFLREGSLAASRQAELAATRAIVAQ